MTTALAPKDDILEQTANVESSGAEPILTHYRRWSVLVCGYAMNTKIPEHVRNVLQQHASSTPDIQAFSGKVLHCHVQLVHGSDSTYRVQFSVSPEFH